MNKNKTFKGFAFILIFLIFLVGSFVSAFNLIKNQRINVDPLLTEKFPLEVINNAFERAVKGEGGKILIQP